MPVSPERLHLLVIAFAVFFACVHDPASRHPERSGAGFPEASTVEAPTPAPGHAGTAPIVHDGLAAILPPVRPVAAPVMPAALPEHAEVPTARVPGFGETPPPRAA